MINHLSTYTVRLQVDSDGVLCPFVAGTQGFLRGKNLRIQRSGIRKRWIPSTSVGQTRVDQRTVFCESDFSASVFNGVCEDPVVVVITLLS